MANEGNNAITAFVTVILSSIVGSTPKRSNMNSVTSEIILCRYYGFNKPISPKILKNAWATVFIDVFFNFLQTLNMRIEPYFSTHTLCEKREYSTSENSYVITNLAYNNATILITFYVNINNKTCTTAYIFDYQFEVIWIDGRP